MKKTCSGSRRFVAERFLDFRDRPIVVLREVGDGVAGLPALVQNRSGNRRAGDHRTTERYGGIDGHRTRRALMHRPRERKEAHGAAGVSLDPGEVKLQSAANAELPAAR